MTAMPDLLLGRSVEPCRFFRNEGGKFVPDEAIDAELAGCQVCHVRLSHRYQRDGLTDLYLTTYCYTAAAPQDWVSEVVPIDDQLPMQLKLMRSHKYLERGGPPNVLLMNRGGKLERVTINDTLKQWKNSYQSVWLDADEDGDQDLYVCNDFSPDVFLRNDTPRGSFDVKFTDFTTELIPGGSMCFGMGASLGDYNADGELDLYVSNMYSKAGKRIIGSLGEDIDPRIKISSQGNFLYENLGGKFEQVAGNDEGDQFVAKVGWSFGGQFADFNNDGRLDLYVPSGYFTAPEDG